MKSLSTRAFLLLAALVNLACGCIPARCSGAQDQTSVAQVIADLNAIHAAAQATPAQERALAADLAAVIDWTVVPSAASVDKLAADLAGAAAAGHFDPLTDASVLSDAQAVLASAGLTPAQIQTLAADVEAIAAESGLTEASAGALQADVQGTVDENAPAASQRVRRTIALQTENIAADLLPDCSGQAELHAIRKNGRIKLASLTVEVSGPFGGAVTVNATRQSDGGNVVIGTLEFDQIVELDPPDASAPVMIGSGEATFLSVHSKPLGGGFTQPLPVGFDPFDVAGITITDAAGTIVQTGSFDASADQKGSRAVNAAIRMAGGAKGALSFTVRTDPARTKRTFLLDARKLPSRTAVILLADGASAGEYVTTGHGELVIAAGDPSTPTGPSGEIIPVNPLGRDVDLLDVRSMALTDSAGNVLASAGF